MSGATIAAFERSINIVSDALADHLASERAVFDQAEREYIAARGRGPERGDARGNRNRLFSRHLRAQERIVRLEALRTPLRALGNGFGEALPGEADQDLLR